jgi:hypothetical protein
MINWKFILRGTLFALLVALILLAVGWAALRALTVGPPSGPLPPPPTIIAPVGELPTGPVGLSEWAKVQGKDYRLVGSGFFFFMQDGIVIGATTSHSVSLGDPDSILSHIALGIPGQTDFVLEMDTLYGEPGKPRRGPNMTGDYVLLRTQSPIDPSVILTPDPRGAPQPGERVVLYSGLGEFRYWGSVHTVDKNGVWVLMDEHFEPGRMSGSPIISAHTGKLVGMALSAAQREMGLFIGMSPIENLVQVAQGAADFPRIADYVR